EGVVLLEQEGRDNLLNFANTGVGEIEYEAYLAEVPTNTPANMQISTKHTHTHTHTLGHLRIAAVTADHGAGRGERGDSRGEPFSCLIMCCLSLLISSWS